MTHAKRGSSSRDSRRGPLLIVALAATVGLFLSGCGGGDEALGEAHAHRLTQGKGLKEFPCFSPDGRTVAYTVSTAEREPDYSVRLVPLEGGESRDLTANDVPQVCFSWAPDGRGVYTLNIWDSSVRLVGLDGTVLARYRSDGLAEPVMISPTGDRILYRRRNNGNFDMGLRRAGKSGLKMLAETPEWEIDGCFGPDDGVTVARRATFFGEESEIATWSPDTGEYLPVNLPGDRNIDPSWSADSRYLAYASDLSGDFDIWIHERETQRTERVTSGPADDRFPSWSPDGRRLAFCRWALVSHVFVKDMGTEDVRQLTAGRSRDRYPVVSPDGAWVVFSRTQAPVDLPRAPQLCVAATSGGPIRQLDTEALKLWLYRDGVSWSPDSREIAFPADDGSGNVDIYRVSRDGGVPARVTIRRGADIAPAWSPDGTCIAYTRGRGNESRSDVWVIPATGGVAEPISSSPGLNGNCVWAPDSDRLLHSSVQNNEAADLWISSRSEPGRSRLVLSNGNFNFPLAWSEDGRTVLFRREDMEGITVWAVSLDGGEPVRIGDYVKTEDGTGQLMSLTATGREYLSRLCPGATQAYTEGEDVGDIYVIEISDLLRSRF